jgi:hypothetical protein
MRPFLSGLVSLAAISVTATALHAQAINIDFGPPGTGPASTYGGVGTPGVWNSIPADHNTYTHNLLGLDGNPTAVRLWQYGGTALATINDRATASGSDHEALMDDCLITYTSNLETCAFLQFLQPGPYEVIVYARMPASDIIKSDTSSDEEIGYPHLEVGGRWPGGHAPLVTYSRHISYVQNNGQGLLRIHSGIVPGADPLLGAAMNGLQIRPLQPCAGDIAPIGHPNWVVNVNDLLAVIGVRVRPPTTARPTSRQWGAAMMS